LHKFLLLYIANFDIRGAFTNDNKAQFGKFCKGTRKILVTWELTLSNKTRWGGNGSVERNSLTNVVENVV